MKRLLAAAAGLAIAAGAMTAAYAGPAIPGHDGMGAMAPMASTSITPQSVQNLRAATAKFHDIAVAEEAGYSAFEDINGVSCIAMNGVGGMGVHWVNGASVGDGQIIGSQPEALVYAPDKDGTLSLAAVEYIVLKADWDANHSSPPKRFGTRFAETDSPNRYGLPDFYSLHVWIWKGNPAGLTAMWNPDVHCEWAPTD